MDKNIANAMLLRLNKQDQIEALKSIGFTTVNENTPASDIAKYMQWSGTLLDFAPNATSSLSPKATALTQAAIKRSNGVATELTYAA